MMNTNAIAKQPLAMEVDSKSGLARSVLDVGAKTWFAVTAMGQWIFVVYVLAYYAPLILGGGFQALGETSLPGGYVPGETVGNLAVVMHLFLAAIIIGGGPLQLIPQIRSRFPVFHHWLGRLYILTVVTTSVAGLYMVWTRGVLGGELMKIAISTDAVLIITFAAIAIYHAISRNIRMHRRWALRLFMVASGVWFYRIGLMGWVFSTGGVGVNFETFSGPFLNFWAFGQYLLPLVLLECYLRAKDSANKHAKLAMGGSLFVLAGVTAFCIFAAVMGLWLPKF